MFQEAPMGLSRQLAFPAACALSLLLATLAAPAAIIFTPPPDAPDGGIGTVGILEVRNAPGCCGNNEDEARTVLSNGTGTRLQGSAPQINFVQDGGGTGHFGGDLSLPGGNGDNKAVIFRGYLNVKTSGQYTFNVNSDDGFTLAFDNGASAFSSVYNGTTDTYNGNPNGAMTFFGQRGAGDTGGTVTLAAGARPFVLTFHDGCCGDSVELSSAYGSHGGFDSAFTLVGATQTIEMKDLGGGTHFNVDVVHGSGAGTNGLAGAIAALNDTGRTHNLGTSTVIDHGDPDTNGGHPFDFPGDVAGNDDDFASRFTGLFFMPVAGTVHFNIHSDDGASLTIAGASWSNVVNSSSVVGDTINADFYTGDTNLSGDAFLSAGYHSLSFLQFEGGGGAFAQLFANGSLLGSFTSPLQFIPEPASMSLLGLAGLALVRRRK
jgi:hypothetical protein